VREAEETDGLHYLIGVEQLTTCRRENGSQVRVEQRGRLRAKAGGQVGLFPLFAVGARPPERQHLRQVLEGCKSRAGAALGGYAHAA
jgi:hypothetical protein